MLDRLARTLIMVRAGAELVAESPEKWRGTCQRCRRIQNLSWCHVFTRGAWSVRWDPENSWAWCRGCHRYLDQHWDAKMDWIIGKIGKDRFELLRIRKGPGRGRDYAATRIYLEQEIRKIRGAA